MRQAEPGHVLRMHPVRIAREVAIARILTASSLAEQLARQHQSCQGILREGASRIELERLFERAGRPPRIAEGVHANASELERGQRGPSVVRVRCDELRIE